MSAPRRGDEGAVLPELGPRSGVPRLSHSIDWNTLVLDDVKGFVLSRVDGGTTLGEIVLLTPFPEPQTLAILVELFVRGVIDIPGTARPVRPSLPGTAPEPSPGGAATVVPPSAPPHAGAAGTNEPGAHERPPARILPRREPSTTDASGALTPEARRRFDELYALLDDDRSPAAAARLLGVPSHADRRTLKRAYFSLSKELHPDRYFRKDIGEYGKKLLTLFNAVKQAYETLDASARR